MEMYKFEQVHLYTFAFPSECIITAIICWGDIMKFIFVCTEF